MGINFEENFDIKNLTSFKIGGKIAKMYFPETIEDFSKVLPEAFIAGNLSNTLVSSNGYDGSVISTSKLNQIKIDGTKVIAGAGVKGPKLSQTVCENGLAGLEFMIGFPGSVGGEVVMNAGANGQCIENALKCVRVYSPDDGIITLSKRDLKFAYRTSICQSCDYIVLEAEFELEQKPEDEIRTRMNENLAFRKSHQPSLALPNCGSIFKNPEGDSAGRLLDSIGAKDMIKGGVRVWENHANFIVNDRTGTSTDVLELMLIMQNKVEDKYNIKLQPEIKFLGSKNTKEYELWKILNKK